MYTVRLHFAEIYWTAAGQRRFNVAINGTQVLTNFDIFATAGANKALVRDFSATPTRADRSPFSTRPWPITRSRAASRSWRALAASTAAEPGAHDRKRSHRKSQPRHRHHIELERSRRGRAGEGNLTYTGPPPALRPPPSASLPTAPTPPRAPPPPSRALEVTHCKSPSAINPVSPSRVTSTSPFPPVVVAAGRSSRDQLRRSALSPFTAIQSFERRQRLRVAASSRPAASPTRRRRPSIKANASATSPTRSAV